MGSLQTFSALVSNGRSVAGVIFPHTRKRSLGLNSRDRPKVAQASPGAQLETKTFRQALHAADDPAPVRVRIGREGHA